MRFIRFFLWTLVAAMTLQGFIHADEYGTAASLLGGMSLTMSVWGESLRATTRSLFGSEPTFVGLPRVLVAAALRESARHPGILTGSHGLPQLKKTLAAHQTALEAFQDAEIHWMIRHADLVAGLSADPVGRRVWESAVVALNETEVALEAAVHRLCVIEFGSRCAEARANVSTLRTEQARRIRAVWAWRSILTVSLDLEIQEWWIATQNSHVPTNLTRFLRSLDELYDVHSTADKRVVERLATTRSLVGEVLPDPLALWERRLLESLLVGRIGTACIRHIRSREGRIRELMVMAGVQDLYNTHERILNASLRVVATQEERSTIHDWFGEMSQYAWWLGDDIPGLVRRCIAQRSGDCARIGPAEITSMTDAMTERSRIVEDWTRRVFIGMWNALPAVGILFLVELVVLLLSRSTTTVLRRQQRPKRVVFHLERPPTQAVPQLT
jgi:hypothetical protein